MNKVFVPDASPLILLEKAGLLTEVSPLAQSWLLAEGVIAEIECQRPIEHFLDDLGKNAEVLRQRVEYVSPLVAGWDLGRGESDVLTLAMSFPSAWAVLDDLQARKCAKILDIPFTGTLGLLLMAKKAGYINTVRPHVENLIAVGLHIDVTTLNRIYKRIGE